jgi:hypothetical protein
MNKIWLRYEQSRRVQQRFACGNSEFRWNSEGALYVALYVAL